MSSPSDSWLGQLAGSYIITLHVQDLAWCGERRGFELSNAENKAKPNWGETCSFELELKHFYHLIVHFSIVVPEFPLLW